MAVSPVALSDSPHRDSQRETWQQFQITCRHDATIMHICSKAPWKPPYNDEQIIEKYDKISPISTQQRITRRSANQIESNFNTWRWQGQHFQACTRPHPGDTSSDLALGSIHIRPHMQGQESPKRNENQCLMPLSNGTVSTNTSAKITEGWCVHIDSGIHITYLKRRPWKDRPICTAGTAKALFQSRQLALDYAWCSPYKRQEIRQNELF
jgi:hypothetical protein